MTLNFHRIYGNIEYDEISKNIKGGLCSAQSDYPK